jgi:hypothetical protein
MVLREARRTFFHCFSVTLSTNVRKKQRIDSNNVPQSSPPYAALREMASFRVTVISIIFSSLPPLGVMNISNSRALSSLILVTLRQIEGPLTGSS